jgi:hypothetical protein
MLRKIAIALAVTGLVGAVSIPIDALAAPRGGGGGHGGGGFVHGGFGGGGFAGRSVAGAPHMFAGRGFAGRGFEPRFRGHRFARFGAPAFGLGLGLGAYSYYDDDSCYEWTPYGYRWVCGYDY